MSKFSIFTIFLSVTVTVIVAEILVNQYINYPSAQKQLTSNVFVAADSGKTVNHDAAVTNTISPSTIENSDSVFLDTEETAVPTEKGPKIDFAMIQNAGFTTQVLQRVPFNGILFNTIDLRNFKSVEVIQNNLLEDSSSRNQTASFYEFDAGSNMLATEIYALIKQKISGLSSVKTNETNQFGENSFYINFDDNAQNAFLIVRAQGNVYALTYRKDYHPLIKQLLLLLSK